MINNQNCNHQWLQVHEESLLGNSFPIGWECTLCKSWVLKDELTPTGLPGTITTKRKLIGINGSKINTASGRSCKVQILDESTGKIEYID